MAWVIELLGRGLVSDFRPLLLPADHEHDPLPADAAGHDSFADPAIRRALALLRANTTEARHRCMDLCETILAAAPSCAAAHRLLACAAYQLPDLPRVRAHLAELAGADPDDPNSWFLLGQTAEQAGQFDAALQHYHRALHACSQHRLAHERLAALALLFGDLDGAIRHYDLLTQLCLERSEYGGTLGALYIAAGRYQAAIDTLEHTLALEPDNWHAPRCDLPDGDEAGEADLLQAALQLEEFARAHPHFPDTLLRLGDLYAALRDTPAALRAWLRAIELHPQYLEAYVRIATLLIRHDRPRDAAAWLLAAMHTYERTLLLYGLLALAQHRSGLDEAANDTLTLVTDLEPHAAFLFSEAHALRTANRPARSAPPDDAHAMLESRLGRAIARQQRYVERHPYDAIAHHELGLLCRQRGDLSQALGAWHRALLINPADARARLHLAAVLHDTGRTNDAWMHLSLLVKTSPQTLCLHHQLALLHAAPRLFYSRLRDFVRTADQHLRLLHPRAGIRAALRNLGLAPAHPPLRACLANLIPEPPESALPEPLARRLLPPTE